MKHAPTMWYRGGLFHLLARFSVKIPSCDYVAVVYFLDAFCVAVFKEVFDKVVVDEDSRLASVAVGTGEVDAGGSSLGFLDCDVAGASVPRVVAVEFLAHEICEGCSWVDCDRLLG